MKNILIADAGSTKVEWVVLSEEGVVRARFSTPGINALLASEKDIEAILAKVKEKIPADSEPSEVFYYGAGCATEAICEKIKTALQGIWPEADIKISTDLLAACHSLLGNRRGIVCILGTGSNSCLYDGMQIEENVPSLGFILGDEGSGSALGKRLVADAFKGRLPRPIRDKFMNYYELTLENILDYTYRRGGANRFLASLVPFIKDHIWNPYLYSIVLEEFTDFLKRNVAMYTGARTLPLCFVGGVADGFNDILREAAQRQGFRVTRIVKSPMDGLICYHSNNNPGNVDNSSASREG